MVVQVENSVISVVDDQMEAANNFFQLSLTEQQNIGRLLLSKVRNQMAVSGIAIKNVVEVSLPPASEAALRTFETSFDNLLTIINTILVEATLGEKITPKYAYQIVFDLLSKHAIDEMKKSNFEVTVPGAHLIANALLQHLVANAEFIDEKGKTIVSYIPKQVEKTKIGGAVRTLLYSAETITQEAPQVKKPVSASV